MWARVRRAYESPNLRMRATCRTRAGCRHANPIACPTLAVVNTYQSRTRRSDDSGSRLIIAPTRVRAARGRAALTMVSATTPRQRSARTRSDASVVLPAPGVPTNSTVTASRDMPQLLLHVVEHQPQRAVRVDHDRV